MLEDIRQAGSFLDLSQKWDEKPEGQPEPEGGPEPEPTEDEGQD